MATEINNGNYLGFGWIDHAALFSMCVVAVSLFGVLGFFMIAASSEWMSLEQAVSMATKIAVVIMVIGLIPFAVFAVRMLKRLALQPTG